MFAKKHRICIAKVRQMSDSKNIHSRVGPYTALIVPALPTRTSCNECPISRQGCRSAGSEMLPGPVLQRARGAFGYNAQILSSDETRRPITRLHPCAEMVRREPEGGFSDYNFCRDKLAASSGGLPRDPNNAPFVAQVQIGLAATCQMCQALGPRVEKSARCRGLTPPHFTPQNILLLAERPGGGESWDGGTGDSIHYKQHYLNFADLIGTLCRRCDREVRCYP
jgi:hypothetical protein